MSVGVCCETIRCVPEQFVSDCRPSVPALPLPVALTGCPTSMAIDPLTDEIYLGCNNGLVLRLNPATLAITGSFFVGSAFADITGVGSDATWVYAQYVLAGANRLRRILKADFVTTNVINSPIYTALVFGLSGLAVSGGNIYISDFHTATGFPAVSKFDAATFTYVASADLDEVIPSGGSGRLTSMVADGTNVFVTSDINAGFLGGFVFRVGIAGFAQTGKFNGGTGSPLFGLSQDATHVYFHDVGGASNHFQLLKADMVTVSVLTTTVSATSGPVDTTVANGNYYALESLPAPREVIVIPVSTFNSWSLIEPLPAGATYSTIAALSSGVLVAGYFDGVCKAKEFRG